LEPGFIRTETEHPEGEWVCQLTRHPVSHVFYNFGGLPSRDYGDAPDSYRTTIGAGGPSHGTLDVCSSVSESTGNPMGNRPSNCDGDDLNGVVLTMKTACPIPCQLRPGATGIIDVTLTTHGQ